MSHFTEEQLMPLPNKYTVTMTLNEMKLTEMIDDLIKGIEEETIGYSDLEKARKLVWSIQNKSVDSTKQWDGLPTGKNLYDLDLTKL